MYLEQRRKGWYALHDIPTDVQKKLGKKRFCQSLKTADHKAAKRRAALLGARWSSLIEAARKGTGSSMEADAAYWREALQTASSDAERDTIKELIADEAQERWYKAADAAQLTDDEHETFDPPEVRKFYEIATGARTKLTEHLEEWLGTLDNTEKSIDQKRSTIKKFAESHPYAQDITRKIVQRYVTALATDEGKKPDTITRLLSELRGYWQYLIGLEVVPEDLRPFDHVKVPAAARKGSKEGQRSAFTAEQVVALVVEAERLEKPQLANLIRLAMWTGARIEELCSLRTENVHGDWFEIVDAKTKAGVRKVPIHTKLLPTMTDLVAASTDGYVLSGLSANKYQDRSPAIGHAFGRMKKDLGYGPSYVFHSIRKTVITLLENAGVLENVAQDIVGHDKPNITFGLYSAGNSLSVMREAINRIDYPVPAELSQAAE